MIFVHAKADHNNNTTFLRNIQRSGFATDLETLRLEINLKVSLGASWKELLHEFNCGVLATKM